MTLCADIDTRCIRVNLEEALILLLLWLTTGDRRLDAVQSVVTDYYVSNTLNVHRPTGSQVITVVVYFG